MHPGLTGLENRTSAEGCERQAVSPYKDRARQNRKRGCGFEFNGKVDHTGKEDNGSGSEEASNHTEVDDVLK